MQSFGPKNSLLVGILLVLIGSASYGMLSTFVKLAYKVGYTTAEVTVAQIGWGAVVVTLLAWFTARKSAQPTRSEKLKLAFAGTTIGLTSTLYYVSVTYIAASIAVVLLMQSIWMGVLFECVVKRKFPTLDKIIAVILVLGGTLLATNAIGTDTGHLDPKGILFGLLSAVSYTGTLASTGNVASHLTPVKRSQYMLYGGVVIVAIFALLTQIAPHNFGVSLVGEGFTHNKPFNFDILFSYGILLGLFGTVLPPIVLNKGFPITGVALGSIISSVELPFAMLIARLLLGEAISSMQLVGVAVIILSVLLLNLRVIFEGKSRSASASANDPI